MDIVLVGLPGSGKSVVGKRLAHRHGATFIDLDGRIEQEDGRPIPRIFEEDGEEAFRVLERRAVADLGPPDPDPTLRRIVATGGGAVDISGSAASVEGASSCPETKAAPVAAVIGRYRSGAAGRGGAAAGTTPMAAAASVIDRVEPGGASATSPAATAPATSPAATGAGSPASWAARRRTIRFSIHQIRTTRKVAPMTTMAVAMVCTTSVSWTASSSVPEPNHSR